MHLGSDLNKNKQFEVEKSSMIPEDFDERSMCWVNLDLLQIIEERDRNIRKLSKKINKLEDTLRKTTAERGKSLLTQGGSGDQNLQL